MNKKQMIEKTKDYVKNNMNNEEPGHDWWHVYRVWKMAKRIGREEKADTFVVEMAALLHDIADWKFHGVGAGAKKTRMWLESLGVEKNDADHIVEIIESIDFKGSAETQKMRTIEGKVVYDADKLDAIGAIGVARCFTFTGYKKRAIFNPKIKPKRKMKFREYKKSESPAINHFYEKLLLLKERMYTRTGKKLAEGRNKFMQQYLEQFFKEWNGVE